LPFLYVSGFITTALIFLFIEGLNVITVSTEAANEIQQIKSKKTVAGIFESSIFIMVSLIV
jgi:hypothetical protein